jgi:glycosyltransferase involved in cell wall biosynthesis/SAM-dependent methyltransferase
MLQKKSTHIVQIGFDDSVFQSNAPSDTLARQLRYGEIILKKRPGSRLTYVVLTSQSGAASFQRGNVTFLPVNAGKVWQLGRLWKSLARLHSKDAIDVLSPQDVNEPGWITLLFGKINRIPVVGQLHYNIFSSYAQDDLFGRGIKGWARRRIVFMALPRFAMLRTVGQATGRQILDSRISGNVRVVPVPVTMLADSAPERVPTPGASKVIFVGRLCHPKNLHLWLEVAKIISENSPNIEFEIIGDGPMAAELQDKCAQLGLADKVRFKGNVAYNELPSYYRDANLFLLTSSYEGFGRVVVEAYAHGIPVVAPRIAGVEDIIEDGQTGFLCQPGNANEMAGKALALLADENLQTQLGQNGRKLVLTRFNPQKLAEAWVDCLLSEAPSYSLVPLRRATFKRWHELSSIKYSLLRSLEYERIKGLTLSGRTLDVGGGEHNSYYNLLKIDGSIESVNISSEIRPTLIANLNRQIPIADAVYDNFISFNTFEHILDDMLAVSEAFRVLKKGGTFHIIVPFLYRVHGSYGDYHRRTAFWWDDYLQSLGILPEHIFIEPLMWDPASSAFAISEFIGRFRALRKRLSMLPAIARHLRWRGHERIPNNYYCAGASEYALGYYINGKK